MDHDSNDDPHKGPSSGTPRRRRKRAGLGPSSWLSGDSKPGAPMASLLGLGGTPPRANMDDPSWTPGTNDQAHTVVIPVPLKPFGPGTPGTTGTSPGSKVQVAPTVEAPVDDVVRRARNVAAAAPGTGTSNRFPWFAATDGAKPVRPPTAKELFAAEELVMAYGRGEAPPGTSGLVELAREVIRYNVHGPTDDPTVLAQAQTPEARCPSAPLPNDDTVAEFEQTPHKRRSRSVKTALGFGPRQFCSSEERYKEMKARRIATVLLSITLLALGATAYLGHNTVARRMEASQLVLNEVQKFDPSMTPKEMRTYFHQLPAFLEAENRQLIEQVAQLQVVNQGLQEDVATLREDDLAEGDEFAMPDLPQEAAVTAEDPPTAPATEIHEPPNGRIVFTLSKPYEPPNGRIVFTLSD